MLIQSLLVNFFLSIFFINVFTLFTFCVQKFLAVNGESEFLNFENLCSQNVNRFFQCINLLKIFSRDIFFFLNL